MNTENIGRVSVSILAIAAFVAYVGAILFVPIPAEMRDVVNTAGGILGGAFVGVINYWIGSSSGSASKDKTITSLSSK
ncbi:hypothetical protein [Reyranella sp.]|uniref:hypothetical protein n=1 Tax=Reyranella sp. TaxID=1929291 RepID=UPI003D1119F9